MNKKSEQLLEQLRYRSPEIQDSISIRENGKTVYRKVMDGIIITEKTHSAGFDMIVSKGAKGKSIHIPVLITEDALNEVVYNDFHIQDDVEVEIIAGCGIHNDSHEGVSHNGIHSFKIGKNCKVIYIEKHLGLGKNKNKCLNPITKIQLGKGSSFEITTHQLGGVEYANRKTQANLGEDSALYVNEKILTTDTNFSKTTFKVKLRGCNSRAEVVSRAVAEGRSQQFFYSEMIGENKCFGHVECDGIITDYAQIYASPKVVAKNIDAMLVHEAAIGKISEEQILKLRTLGLSPEDAKKKIIEGFLK